METCITLQIVGPVDSEFHAFRSTFSRPEPELAGDWIFLRLVQHLIIYFNDLFFKYVNELESNEHSHGSILPSIQVPMVCTFTPPWFSGVFLLFVSRWMVKKFSIPDRCGIDLRTDHYRFPCKTSRKKHFRTVMESNWIQYSGFRFELNFRLGNTIIRANILQICSKQNKTMVR